MIILQLISSLGPGGAERFTTSLSNELSIKGHDVLLCTLYGGTEHYDYNKNFLNERVKYVNLDISGLSLFKIVKVIHSFIRRTNPDVINCHLSVLQYLIFDLFLPHNFKIYHTLHSLARYASGGDKWHARFFRFLYKSKIVVPITISEECHKSFLDFYKLDCDIIIKNGCEPAQTSPKIKDVQNEIRLYKKNEDTIVFIHVARFHKAKNQKMLIESFNRLYKEGLNFILLILGDGFDCKDGIELQNKACDNIYFLGAKNNVGDYLSCSNAFCLTSIYEGLPISLLEAMSLGIVPICTPVGGIKDVLTNGLSGYMSDDVTVESYCLSVHNYINNKLDPITIKQAYYKSYSMSKCASNYLNIYSSI